MPMGFTWSVAVAHRLANACLRIAYLSARMKIPEHRRPPQQFKCLSQTAGTVHILEGDLLILHIIDDINAIAAGWRSSDLILSYRECDRTFAQHGLRRKPSKSSPLDAVVTDCLPFIGWQWHLHENIIRPDPTKLLNYLSQAMIPSIYSQKTPVRLRSLVGHLIWIALAIRPALSFLKTTFLVTHHTRTSTSALRLAARREVSALSAVLPLAHINPDRKLWTTLVAFDASQAAAGVSFALITLSAAEFIYDLAAKGHEISPLEMHKYHTIVKCSKWVPAFSHKWRRSQHIDALEEYTGVLALKWAATHGMSGKRLVLLSDSTATIEAFSKGRSSSANLALPARRFAAIALAHDLCPRLLYIPSRLNPADSPSRPN
ncbi:hypothetical protein FGB62_21g03 [Gracilaria domingensis]|nr:hypothetical protein FGB62_21g03 [Gracilaria domingensis]